MAKFIYLYWLNLYILLVKLLFNSYFKNWPKINITVKFFRQKSMTKLYVIFIYSTSSFYVILLRDYISTKLWRKALHAHDQSWCGRLKWQWTKFLWYLHVEMGTTWNLKKLVGILCLDASTTQFYFTFFYLNIFCINGKTMDEGIAYLGPIMMWLHLNCNGLNFYNTLMLS